MGTSESLLGAVVPGCEGIKNLPMVYGVLTLLLTGCVSDSGENADGGSHGSPDLADGRATVASNRGTDCSEAIVMVPVSFEHANSLLPDGFEAADLSTTFGLPAPVGSATAAIFVVHCEDHDWGQEQLSYGGVSLGVNPPSIDGAEGHGDVHFYVFESYGSNAAMQEFLEGIGWAIVSTDATLERNPLGPAESVEVTVEGSLGYEMDLEVAVPTSLDGVYRSWHVTDQGIAYVDYVTDQLPALAGKASCTFQGRAAEVSGISDCSGEAVAGVLLIGDWTGEFHLLESDSQANGQDNGEPDEAKPRLRL